MENQINWKDWYFAKAKQPDPFVTKLVFDVIKPGCTLKIMEQISQGVLDVENPFVVNWRFVRFSHAWLKRDVVDRRTFNASLTLHMRLAGRGFYRGLSGWIQKAAGWTRKADKTALSFITEQQYMDIEKAALHHMPKELAIGVTAAMRLVYYCGLKASTVYSLKREDVVNVDGRTLLYKSGKLYDLPDHVRVPLAEWIRRPTIRPGVARGRIFNVAVNKALIAAKELHSTFTSMRRLA